PCIEHDRHFRSFSNTTELNDRLSHFLSRRVLQQRYLEIQSLQSEPNVGCVTRRVGKLWDLLVRAIADNERNPTFGGCWLREEPAGSNETGCCPDSAKKNPANDCSCHVPSPPAMLEGKLKWACEQSHRSFQEAPDRKTPAALP